jgi:hypothetical protein
LPPAHAVELDHLLLGVGEQGEVEAALLRPTLVAVDILRRDAQEHRAALVELREIVSVRAHLTRATGVVVTGIEREHDLAGPRYSDNV